MISKIVATACVLVPLMWGQVRPGWQDDVRRCADKHDWSTAMQIVEQQITAAPNDMDVRAWRARVLLWSGRIPEARNEYLEILAVAPNDPDNWLGLGSAYSREGRSDLALQALTRALALDPNRADIHAARGRMLRNENRLPEAKQEFQIALRLDSANQEARLGLLSLRPAAKHELRIGSETDLFSFMGSGYNEELRLRSRWTQKWGTAAGVAAYHIGGIDAPKGFGELTYNSSKWGALTIGGAAAHDNGIVPQHELYLDYDHGFKIGAGAVRALEIDGGPHWYEYASARILTARLTSTLYFPQGWTWSLGLIEARSDFVGTQTEWHPSGISRLGFPLVGGDEGRLSGNVFFATGTENFAQVDQIGRFSSQTYGGGLRLQLTPHQDLNGVAAFQKRTQDRSEISFGFNYGIRF